MQACYRQNGGGGKGRARPNSRRGDRWGATADIEVLLRRVRGRDVGLFLADLGHLLALEAEGEEDVAQALEVHGFEELRGEVDGEVGAVVAELAGQRRPVHGRDDGDQLFHLVRLQHLDLLLSLRETRRAAESWPSTVIEMTETAGHPP